MNYFVKWSAAHILHWAILYGAFVLSLDGAMYLLKFCVWTMAPLSLFLLADKAAAAAAKTPPKPVISCLNMLQAWITLGLLVWHGHIATGLAWLVVIVMTAWHRDATKKARQATAPSAA